MRIPVDYRGEALEWARTHTLDQHLKQIWPGWTSYPEEEPSASILAGEVPCAECGQQPATGGARIFEHRCPAGGACLYICADFLRMSMADLFGVELTKPEVDALWTLISAAFILGQGSAPAQAPLDVALAQAIVSVWEPSLRPEVPA